MHFIFRKAQLDLFLLERYIRDKIEKEHKSESSRHGIADTKQTTEMADDDILFSIRKKVIYIFQYKNILHGILDSGTLHRRWEWNKKC